MVPQMFEMVLNIYLLKVKFGQTGYASYAVFIATILVLFMNKIELLQYIFYCISNCSLFAIVHLGFVVGYYQ